MNLKFKKSPPTTGFEPARGQNERSIADTEYLTRELAARRNSLGEVATRDFVRSELADLVEELAKELRRDTQSDSE